MGRSILFFFIALSLLSGSVSSLKKVTTLLGHIVNVHQGFDHHHVAHSTQHSHSHDQESDSDQKPHSHGFDFSSVQPVFIFASLESPLPRPACRILDISLIKSFSLLTQTFHSQPFRPPIFS